MWPAQPPLAATCSRAPAVPALRSCGPCKGSSAKRPVASGSEDACKRRRSVVGRRLAVGRRRPAAITAWRPAEAGRSWLRLWRQGSGLGGCGRASSTPSCAQEEQPQWQCFDPATTLTPQPRPCEPWGPPPATLRATPPRQAPKCVAGHLLRLAGTNTALPCEGQPWRPAQGCRTRRRRRRRRRRRGASLPPPSLRTCGCSAGCFTSPGADGAADHRDGERGSCRAMQGNAGQRRQRQHGALCSRPACTSAARSAPHAPQAAHCLHTPGLPWGPQRDGAVLCTDCALAALRAQGEMLFVCWCCWLCCWQGSGARRSLQACRRAPRPHPTCLLSPPHRPTCRSRCRGSWRGAA